MLYIYLTDEIYNSLHFVLIFLHLPKINNFAFRKLVLRLVGWYE